MQHGKKAETVALGQKPLHSNQQYGTNSQVVEYEARTCAATAIYSAPFLSTPAALFLMTGARRVTVTADTSVVILLLDVATVDQAACRAWSVLRTPPYTCPLMPRHETHSFTRLCLLTPPTPSAASPRRRKFFLPYI